MEKQNDDVQQVPFICFESELARLERCNKRLTVGFLILAAVGLILEVVRNATL